jgi:prepilin-type N-terminal cleavage/methylation domain-containing protein
VSRVVGRLLRRVRSQGGYTLPELLVTMIIMGIVMGGITGLFSSGMKAETDVAFRAQSQNQLRNALGYLRQEVHCASGATLPAAAGTPPVQTLTLTMPTGCFRPAGETSGTSSIWCTVYISTNRYALYRQGNSASCGATSPTTTGRLMADYLTKGSAVFAYVPPSTELGILKVDFTVDSNSQSLSPNAYRLVDDIVLRNTVRS